LPMPYKRRRYGSSKRLSRPAYYYAKYLDMAYRQQQADSNLQKIANISKDVSGAGTVSFYNPATGLYGPQTQAEAIKGLAARGRGGYGLGALGGSIGGLVGGSLGNRRAGRAVGSFLGRAAGDYLGGGGYIAAGSGEYGLATNSLISGSSVAVPTMMGGDEIGSIVVSHKEYLGNITGSGRFENSAFQLNPGLPQTFPWLSQIAQNYEEYNFVQLMFTYTSLLSDSTAAGVIGSILMSTNYNAGQPDFTNSADMLNNIGTVSARPIDGPIIHGIECDDSKNVQSSYYVRAGSVPSGEDIKSYDMGRFQIATEGMPADNELQGQLWVSYCVVLRKPKIFTAAGKGIGSDVFKLSQGYSCNNDYICGKVLVKSPMNNIGTTVSCPAAMYCRIFFPPTTVQGHFRLKWSWLNPSDGTGFPNQPKMAPEFNFSNCSLASPQLYAHYISDNESLCNNHVFQTGTYQKSPGSSLEWEPQIMFEAIIKLGGSFAVETYIDIYFPYFSGTWSASQCMIEVDQINPDQIASTFNSPAGWIPVVVSQ